MNDSNRRLHGTWSSRWTFILAATGSAVGLGNIWKFPYIAGENGGGAFVLIYLVCILLVGVPVMMAEVMLGRKGGMSPINTMRHLAEEAGGHRAWSAVGWVGMVVGVLILSYYSVIAGWALHYIGEMAGGALQGASGRDSAMRFAGLLADPKRLMALHTVFILLTMGVVIGGVTHGLGVAVRTMMPLLFLLLVVLLLYGADSGNFAAGLDFMFSFRFDGLTWKGVLEALGHAFFSLSLGMGAIMAYGAYMPEDAPIGKSVVTIAFFDTLVALMMGLAIFSMVFAVPGLAPDAGPSLMFQTLPVVFGNMSGGLLFGVLFFMLVALAAWSSSISLIEPGVAWLIETHRFNRITANLLLGGIAWVLGIGTVLSFNLWQDYTLGDSTFFDVLDFLTASILLPLTGMFIAIFAGWVMRKEVATAALGDRAPRLLALWYWLLRYVAPVAIGGIFLFGLYSKLI
ncbi:MAG: sodium-dependent transporter [Porticoccaceae bacterium]|nr:sodium-dependent transporter [Porticoccaceae bacterium]